MVIAAAMVSVNDGGIEQGTVQNRGVCRVYMTGVCAGQGNVQDRGGGAGYRVVKDIGVQDREGGERDRSSIFLCFPSS